jgi:hypothetical protein
MTGKQGRLNWIDRAHIKLVLYQTLVSE